MIAGAPHRTRRPTPFLLPLDHLRWGELARPIYVGARRVRPNGEIFHNPANSRTEAYVTGRVGQAWKYQALPSGPLVYKRHVVDPFVGHIAPVVLVNVVDKWVRA
jgi:hypothetical protein